MPVPLPIFGDLDDPTMIVDPWSNALGVGIQLLILAGVIWIVWQVLRPRPEFQIKIEQRVPIAVAGKFRPQLLKDLADVIEAAQLDRGTITARRQKDRVVLQFSREFSPALQQQIRNTWYAHS